MTKNDKENEILNDITNLLLSEDLTKEDREILLVAKKDLEHKVYFPKIIKDLEASLTPLAMQQKLSKSISPFYLKITSHEFKNKYQGFGYGLGMMFSGGK
ncbi:bacteriocin immunity protein [Leuconostoc carnosum]|uniref:Bacteriocin immunity protein n=1 Tax=Leuconostoc carnosum (strain JB16) TaxID=1229758 RepID=K0DC20_LEUCJ|nr:bacteriocin immunity protein [Leuconostoc carnosum]AFT82428.1 hypothetical protein C270_07595 [Leuconostoc carnosum JB16]KAA8327107.1 bacteriocin immunity protein [Leuconostoc carnosum]KAA8369472.1 bacteriocin immunity protein [Leuconostoc carnosum]KAA8380491.1 bacteriocin immunity protein [Leuconostoc carnosum]